MFGHVRRGSEDTLRLNPPHYTHAAPERYVFLIVFSRVYIEGNSKKHVVSFPHRPIPPPPLEEPEARTILALPTVSPFQRSE